MMALLDIVFCTIEDPLSVVVIKLSYDPCRGAYDQDIIWECLPLCENCPCSNEAAFANGHAIEHDSLYADEGSVTYGAPMKHGLVPDSDAVSDPQRDTVIGMEDAAILNVRADANFNDVVVAP